MSRRFLIVIASFAVLVSATVVTAPSDAGDDDDDDDMSFLRGDCNDDGNVDLADGIYLLSFIFVDPNVPFCNEVCDTNGDGVSNIADFIYQVSYFFLGGQPPPPPFPTCGSTLPATCPDYDGCNDG